jgi:hypothetical protein
LQQWELCHSAFSNFLKTTWNVYFINTILNSDW